MIKRAQGSPKSTNNNVCYLLIISISLFIFCSAIIRSLYKEPRFESFETEQAKVCVTYNAKPKIRKSYPAKTQSQGSQNLLTIIYL